MTALLNPTATHDATLHARDRACEVEGCGNVGQKYEGTGLDRVLLCVPCQPVYRAMRALTTLGRRIAAAPDAGDVERARLAQEAAAVMADAAEKSATEIEVLNRYEAESRPARKGLTSAAAIVHAAPVVTVAPRPAPAPAQPLAPKPAPVVAALRPPEPQRPPPPAAVSAPPPATRLRRKSVVPRPDANAHPELCRVAGCLRPPEVRGVCRPDWLYLCRHGTHLSIMLPNSRDVAPMVVDVNHPPGRCRIKGCNGRAVSRDLCGRCKELARYRGVYADVVGPLRNKDPISRAIATVVSANPGIGVAELCRSTGLSVKKVRRAVSRLREIDVIAPSPARNHPDFGRLYPVDKSMDNKRSA